MCPDNHKKSWDVSFCFTALSSGHTWITFMDHATGTTCLYNVVVLCNADALCNMKTGLCDTRTVLFERAACGSNQSISHYSQCMISFYFRFLFPILNTEPLMFSTFLVYFKVLRGQYILNTAISPLDSMHLIFEGFTGAYSKPCQTS